MIHQRTFSTDSFSP
ncbi:Rab GTPase activator-like protein, partial [Candida albicans P75016]